MYFERLNEQNVEHYIAYLKLAMQQEPDMMTVEEIDEEGIRTRLRDSFYEKSASILAMENNQVAGRIEYHFYGCCRLPRLLTQQGLTTIERVNNAG